MTEWIKNGEPSSKFLTESGGPESDRPTEDENNQIKTLIENNQHLYSARVWEVTSTNLLQIPYVSHFDVC